LYTLMFSSAYFYIEFYVNADYVFGYII